jgi:hypothetical protein
MSHDPTPATDPWAADALTLGFARTGHTQQLPTYMAQPPRRRRTRWLVVFGTVAAILAGVGGYAGASAWFGWNIAEPETVFPGSTAIFARLDLSPGLGQRIALGRIAAKFPHSDGNEDVADALKRQFLGVDRDTYETEIKPWAGDRLATGIWSQDRSAAQACTLTALASKDDQRAEASLQRVRARQQPGAFGYQLVSPYVLLATCHAGRDSQSAVADAVAEGRTSPLDARSAFRAAVSQLPSGPVAVAWADLAPAAVIAPDSVPHAMTGQAVAGLRASDTGLELAYRISGTGVPRPTVDVVPRLAQLPDTTVVGICTDLNGAATALHDVVQSVKTLLAGSAFAAVGNGLDAILGSVVSVSITTQPDVSWRLTADTGADTKARDVAGLFGLGAALNAVSVQTSGSTVTVTRRGYQPGAGHLGELAGYRAAMPTVRGRPAAAVYIDLPHLTPSLRLTAEQAANLAPITGIGMVAADDGGTFSGVVRVLVP